MIIVHHKYWMQHVELLKGSILSPLLFILYINDIANALPTANILSFADDTTLYLSHTDIKLLYSNGNSHLQYLIICPRQRKYDQTNQNLIINEYEIAQISSTGRKK